MMRICLGLTVFCTIALLAAGTQAAEFNVNSEQYGRLLDMMQDSGVMLPYEKECQQEEDYICTIKADQIVIITYAQSASSNLTAISFSAKSKSVDRVSSLAAVASLSLNKNFVRSENSARNAAMMKAERETIEKQMMSMIIRGGDPTMELTKGGERFYYQPGSGLATVRVVPRDWE